MRIILHHKTVPRDDRWSPGVPPPSVESCVRCVPPPNARADILDLFTSNWFYSAADDIEVSNSFDRVYEHIGLLATLFAIIVQGMLSSARDIENADLKGMSVVLCGMSMFMLVASAFFSIVHLVFTQKMTLDSQVSVFNMLYLSKAIRFLSPIRFLQGGIVTGSLAGLMWVFGFLEIQYSILFFLTFAALASASVWGFLLLTHAGTGVLEADMLRTGEQASLDWDAIGTLLAAYEEDAGSDFLNPEGFLAFCGECLLQSGCDSNDICEFSHVTKLRMQALIAHRVEELTDWRGFLKQTGGTLDDIISLPGGDPDHRISLKKHVSGDMSKSMTATLKAAIRVASMSAAAAHVVPDVPGPAASPATPSRKKAGDRSTFFKSKPGIDTTSEATPVAPSTLGASETADAKVAFQAEAEDAEDADTIDGESKGGLKDMPAKGRKGKKGKKKANEEDDELEKPTAPLLSNEAVDFREVAVSNEAEQADPSIVER
jgi:hypothetical protein